MQSRKPAYPVAQQSRTIKGRQHIWKLALAASMVAASHAHAAVATWQATGGPVNQSIFCLLPGSDGEVLAGSDMGGLFRSLDNGLTWKNRSFLPNTAEIHDLERLPDGRLLAAGFGGGMFRSADN